MSFLPNLRNQLYTMAGVKESLEAELVPAFFGNGVESKASFNGFCYSFISSYEQELSCRLSQIRDLFIQAAERLKEACLIHSENFRKEISGDPFDLIQKTKTERLILQTCTYLNPFIQQYSKDLDLPYLRYLNEGQDKRALFFIFGYARLVKKTKNLELTTGLPVPFRELIQLHSKRKLNAKDSDTIDAWIKALEDSRSLDIATFQGSEKNSYVLVHSIHRYFSKLSVILYWNTAKLEIALTNRGCKLFDEPDPHWIRIRNQVKSGDVYSIEGIDYKVDVFLMNKENDPKLPMVFSLQDKPDLNLTIYPNEACGLILLRQEKKEHYGIITAKRVARYRAMFIMERLYHPLNSIFWDSRDGKISERDLIQAHPIVGLLAGLSLQPCTPLPLSPHLFAFNYEGEMRALELMRVKMGPMSFEAIEDFALECALNADGSVNAAVFKHLMHSGKVASLPHAKSYHELMISALEDQEIERAVSLDGVLTKPEHLEFRREFFLKIQVAKGRILDEILSLYQILDVKKLDESLVSAFKAVHTRDCPGRILLASFFDECKTHALRELKPRMNPKDLLPVRATLIDRIASSDLESEEVRQIWEDETIYELHRIFNRDQQKEIRYHGNSKYKKINYI